MGRFVVIYHPGGHAKHQKPLPWTTDKHKRKFMQMSGYATSAPDIRPTKKNELYFWGEYEPDTTGTPLTVPSGAIPNAYPYRVDVPDPIVPQQQQGVLNTDPFVFCGPLIYSNCMQHHYVNIIANLQPDDVLLFGSSLNKAFVLDTCIVVDTATDLASYPFNPTSLFKYITGNLIRSANYRIVEGTTWSAGTPFSFVPAWDRLQPSNIGHPRPIIDLGKILAHTHSTSIYRPGQTSGMHSIGGSISNSKILAGMWSDVVAQVLNQGCLLGTSIDHPACHIQLSGTTNNPAASGGCSSASSSATKGGNPAPDVIGGSC